VLHVEPLDLKIEDPLVDQSCLALGTAHGATLVIFQSFASVPRSDYQGPPVPADDGTISLPGRSRYRGLS
jgi:hypothetical protein